MQGFNIRFVALQPFSGCLQHSWNQRFWVSTFPCNDDSRPGEAYHNISSNILSLKTELCAKWSTKCVKMVLIYTDTCRFTVAWSCFLWFLSRLLMFVSFSCFFLQGQQKCAPESLTGLMSMPSKSIESNSCPDLKASQIWQKSMVIKGCNHHQRWSTTTLKHIAKQSPKKRGCKKGSIADRYQFQSQRLPLCVHFPHRTPTSSNLTETKNTNLLDIQLPTNLVAIKGSFPGKFYLEKKIHQIGKLQTNWITLFHERWNQLDQFETNETWKIGSQWFQTSNTFHPFHPWQ